MRNRRRLAARAALVVLGALVYRYDFSPAARAQRFAHRFWEAATAGDLQAVEAMVAPDALVSASQWVAENEGLPFLG